MKPEKTRRIDKAAVERQECCDRHWTCEFELAEFQISCSCVIADYARSHGSSKDAPAALFLKVRARLKSFAFLHPRKSRARGTPDAKRISSLACKSKKAHERCHHDTRNNIAICETSGTDHFGRPNHRLYNPAFSVWS